MSHQRFNRSHHKAALRKRLPTACPGTTPAHAQSPHFGELGFVWCTCSTNWPDMQT